ncbi:exodeoxyribonuclease V subunit alpha [Borreliella garinii]|uniref:exodeoxyribonuclease V subunit alpha n=1 Tax=Borreliella garinii TaxID=29519 RepID=UPI00018E2784|nr:exodeoxyribonuclease V subunit alpha [Borreliella garinii]EED29751.1 exodeoxyribonuclease V, alpha subunit [Borreliella garinii Far04]WNZ66828.1 exodeoxyribonuclease V subunit alpha [Borreliella garinii]WNZ67824.1 exodeoxyribonuclease V subunit alpha [Borreliella garinii]WNZ68821.1 exodeoxyribonuclease V subunit alpha [Borreliella garinii]WNZ69821.1 exodeoxyribonuclease V subunit alpha [Borreliella garinii]
MRDFLVLREFLKDKNKKFLTPELKLYEMIELLNINKKNYYKAQTLAKSINDGNIVIFLIFLFNYYDKGHLRANIKLLAKDIQNTITLTKDNLEKTNKNYNKLIKMLKGLEIFGNLETINNIVSLLKKNNILMEFNKLKITTPLILENNIYIYTQKNYREEEELIKQIIKRLENHKSELNDNEIQNIISNLNTSNLNKEQITSVRKALKSNFFLLSGGPGTGKTTTINYILKAINQTLNNKKKRLVAITAPTGKASLRLQTSIDYSFKNLEIECNTIQKLLGIKFINKKNLYDEENQLNFDVIIIDEASMVDAYTFLKLLKATPITTKLIIVGDKNQLPSVNEGNVYSSLLGIKKINNDNVEDLKENFRSNKEINLLSKAIYKEDSTLICKYINNNENIKLKEIEKINLKKDLIEYINNLYRKIPTFNLKLLKESKIETILETLLENIILSSKNFGKFGTKTLNEIIKNYLKKTYGNFIGQIIMITKTDYKNKLFNGERGIIFNENSKFYALFQRKNEKYKKINLDLLTNYEFSFATTIHKSQGSEYKHIKVILENNPFLTKELMYTAITRAKDSLEIISNKETILKLSKKASERDSKILEHLNSFKEIDK